MSYETVKGRNGEGASSPIRRLSVSQSDVREKWRIKTR